MRFDASLLQHDTDAPLEVGLALLGIETQHADLATGPRSVAFQDLDGRRLAGSIGPQEREHLAAFDAEVDAGNGLQRAVRLAQPLDLDGRVGVVHASGPILR